MVRRYGYAVLKWVFLLTVTSFFALAVKGIFAPGSFMTSGNLHDVFIPYNAVLYGLQGMVQHRDFHTPFGWIYGALNQLAWHALLDRKLASINELIPMASLVWLGLIAVLYAVFLLALPEWVRPSLARIWLFLLFLALITFNFKGASGFSVRDLNWYGTYNNHLWAVLFLQMIGVFLVADAQQSMRAVLALAVLNGVGVFLTLNYKISFGMASLMLAAAPLVFNWSGVRWRGIYIAVGLAVSVLLTIGLAPAEYDFRLYLADIGVAAAAKADNRGPVVGVWVWGVAFVAWFSLAIMLSLDERYSAKGPGRLRSGALMSQLILTALPICATLLAIMGDFARPIFFLLVCLATYVLAQPANAALQRAPIRALKVGSLAVFVICIVGYQSSNMRVAYYKQHPISSRNYRAVTYETPYGALQWTIRKESGFGPLSELFRMSEHPQRLLIQSAITYRAHPYRDDVSIAFKNLDYIAAISAIEDWMRARGMGRDRVVTVLDFINPIPMLMGTPMPQGSSHWLHFGTSVPVSGHDDLVFDAVRNSDVLVIPITSFDSNGQSLLNCRFHEWNQHQAKPFVPTFAGKYHIFYEREPKGPALGLDEADIEQRCAFALKQFRAGAISPN